jgi:23S rRNA (adenine2503-C2)-methyltransferase
MGMGEPLLNLDNLLLALEAICDPERLGLGSRRITVSTSGIPAGIRRLAQAGQQWKLALSMHAVTDAARARLIPAAQRYPIREILDACQYYKTQTGRNVTLEYALIGNENCSLNDARQLAQICRDLKGKINLIPYNETSDRYRAPKAAEIRHFETVLKNERVPVTVRRRKGDDIDAACGQLRQNHSSRTL